MKFRLQEAPQMDSITPEQTGRFGNSAYRFLIKQDDALLLVVNFQDRLYEVMEQGFREAFLHNNQALIKTALALDVPIIVSEQLPEHFGSTMDGISELIGEAPKIAKISFSCWREGRIMAEIKKTSRKTIIVTGMEAHVCVLQTVIDLMLTGHTAVLATDAVCSRFAYHRETAVNAMVQAGAVAYPTESIVFMLMENAGEPVFENIMKLLGWSMPQVPSNREIVNR